MDHSGPIRGNRRNNTKVKGKAWATKPVAVQIDANGRILNCIWFKPTSALVTTINANTW
jgi:hypothetical protein